MKTLVLTTTYIEKKVDRFFTPQSSKLNYPQKEGIEEMPNDVYRIKNDLFFAHPSIKGNTSETNLLVQFVDNVIKHLNEKEFSQINQILYFIHSGDIGLDNDYFVEITDYNATRISSLKKKIENLFSKNEPTVRLVAFKHDPKNFFGRLLLKEEEISNKEIIWSEYIAEEFRQYINERSLLWKKEHSTILNKNLPFDFNISYLYAYNKITTTLKKNSPFKELNLENKTIESHKKIKIVFVDTQSLNTKERTDKLAEHLLSDHPQNSPVPHLFIGSWDIMCEWSGEGAKEHKEKVEKLNLNKRYRFFDSSIWARYISIETNGYGESFEQQLKRVIHDFETYYEQGLYFSNVAKEFLEFNCRLFKNSYLKEFKGGGHASDITPFIFHSESLMQQKANILQEEFAGKKLRWDFLLIDDFAKKSLSSKGDEQITDKLSVIKSAIENSSNDSSIIGKKIQSAISIKEGAESLDKKTYDVILLDYLFSQTNNGERYGTRFLEMVNNNEIINGKAVSYKYWIFPVSVFSDALHSALEEKGIQYLEKHWVLARGADPVSTPHLFRNSLFQFLKLQYQGLGFELVHLVKLWLNQHRIENNEVAPIDARVWARQFYQSLIEQYGKANTLHFKSSFAETAKEYFNIDQKNIKPSEERYYLEELKNILHDLAFASIYDLESTAKTFKNFVSAMQNFLLPKLSGNDKELFEQQLKYLGESVLANHNNYEEK